MDLYPAIDLLGGRVVQLRSGDFDASTDHGGDPVAVALAFQEAGAPWVHVVDLDAARSGERVNAALVAAVAGAVSVPVQAGGGVRTERAAAELADAGVARVVLGTVAVEGPALVERVAARQPVAVGLDVRGEEVVVRGWLESSGRSWRDALGRLRGAGAEAVVVTQVRVEGLLGGPDLDGLAAVAAATDLDVIASGGVGSLDDLRALRALPLAGAIVGTALYEGRFTAAEAVDALA